MSHSLNTTGAALNAILGFINPKNTPKIAYNNDKLAQPLIDKIKNAVGTRDGSQRVSLWFDDDEELLREQFHGVCKNIKNVFDQIEFCTK